MFPPIFLFLLHTRQARKLRKHLRKKKTAIDALEIGAFCLLRKVHIVYCKVYIVPQGIYCSARYILFIGKNSCAVLRKVVCAPALFIGFRV